MKRSLVIALIILALCWNNGFTAAAFSAAALPKDAVDVSSMPEETVEPGNTGTSTPPAQSGDAGTATPPSGAGDDGTTTPPSGSAGDGTTTPPSGSDSSGTTIPPSGSDGSGTTIPPSGSDGGGTTTHPSGSGDDGTTTPPSESDGDGTTTPPSEPDTGEPDGLSYIVDLGPCQIGAGETLSYTTVSSSFAGTSVPEGYYPGALTINLTGQIVVESGGRLEIGTLSSGGSEASPVITGTGQIVVKAGGQLHLARVTLESQGQGPVIVQEPGGSVELVETAVGEGDAQWSVPLVNNLYDSPDDVWIEAGTVLSSDLLPASMRVTVQDQGHENDVDVPLSWDMSGYDGRTTGELVLTGSFLDEAGQPMYSLCPLEVTVHWYTPETLVVTDAQWKGSSVPIVQLTVPQLPAYADVWGEVSTDGGLTWVRWEDPDQFFIVEVENEGWACIFKVSDGMSGLFRIAAEDRWAAEYTYWRSAAFAMSPTEDDEDSGGNRGGSTTPDTPDRQPEPVPEPDRPTVPDDSETETESPENGQPEDSQQDNRLPEDTSGGNQSLETQEPQEGLEPPVQPQTPSQEDESAQDTQQTTAESQQESTYHPEHLTQWETEQSGSSQDTVEEGSGALSQDNGAGETGEEDIVSQPDQEAPAEDAADIGAGETADSPRTLPVPAQFALVAVGLALCAGVTAAVARLLRKKK